MRTLPERSRLPARTPGSRASTSARARACSSALRARVRALFERDGQQGQPGRLEPGRRLCARARQGDARAGALRDHARLARSPGRRRPPTRGGCSSASAASQSRTPRCRPRCACAPPVPTTSIYSRTDGIVAWQLQPEPAGAAGREHRGACEPHRPGHESARDDGHRRSARAAIRRGGGRSTRSGARRFFFRPAACEMPRSRPNGLMQLCEAYDSKRTARRATAVAAGHGPRHAAHRLARRTRRAAGRARLSRDPLRQPRRRPQRGLRPRRRAQHRR